MSNIAAINNKQYTEAEISASVKRIFELFSLKDKIKPDMRVMLKPNLVIKRTPNEATTTHPLIVKAVTDELVNIGVTDIVIAESPGGPYTKAALSGIYKVCGMEMAEGARVNMDFSTFTKTNEDNLLVKEFTLINPVKEADYIINLPKIKTHAMMTFSGAVKNIFGTVPGLMKPELHWRFPNINDFADMIIDLCETVKPNFSIIDAVVGMEGDGPTGGTAKECGYIFAGENPYLLDVYASSVIGLEPYSLPIIHRAAERGIIQNGEMPNNIGDSNITPVVFETPKSKNLDFSEHIPRIFQKAVYKIVTSKPKIKEHRCVGCGKCAESCPAKTIVIVKGKARINYKECIHCFCCHEMCPVKAIDIKRLSLFNW